MVRFGGISNIETGAMAPKLTFDSSDKRQSLRNHDQSHCIHTFEGSEADLVFFLDIQIYTVAQGLYRLQSRELLLLGLMRSLQCGAISRNNLVIFKAVF